MSEPPDPFPPGPRRNLTFEVVEGDIIAFAADLVAFKYARGFHGADRRAAEALQGIGIDVEALQPEVGEYRLLDPGSAIAARKLLFVGVPPLHQFGYQQIREFGISVIRTLCERVPDCRQLAMTLHGPGYGLDEVEALFSMLTGCMEAMADRSPPSLEQISVVERDAARVGRLRRALQQASHHSGELSVTETERGWLVAENGVISDFGRGAPPSGAEDGRGIEPQAAHLRGNAVRRYVQRSVRVRHPASRARPWLSLRAYGPGRVHRRHPGAHQDPNRDLHGDHRGADWG